MKKNRWPIVLLLVFLFLPFNSRGQSSIEKTIKTISIQVVSLKQIERAEQELERLKSHGLNAFMRHEDVRDKGMWYRIYVGQFENRDEATKFAQNIKDRRIIAGFWVKQIEIPAEPEKTIQETPGQPESPEMKEDLERKEQAPPPIVIETPRTVVPTEEKPSPLQSSTAKPTEQTPSFIQPPVEAPKTVISEKTQETVPANKKEPEESFPAEDGLEKEPVSPVQGIAVQGPGKWIDRSRFSLGAKSSYFLASDTKDLKIKRTDGGDRYSWSIENPKVYSSLIANYRFNPTISIEATIERAFFTKLDVWHLNMGPKFEFKKMGMLTPYAKGSLIMGHMKWDDVPGDFDTAWGWEGGLGVSFARSNLQFGLETSYRSITYDYNRPSDASVTATDDQIDFSGFALSATLLYRF